MKTRIRAGFFAVCAIPLCATVEELGLKLEASRGPVHGFVIEHAEKPSAN